MIKACPDCNSKLYDYFDINNGFTQYVCMKCFYYMSNSPAYFSNPDGFKNMVRENPSILNKLINRKFTGQRNNRKFDRTLKSAIIACDCY